MQTKPRIPSRRNNPRARGIVAFFSMILIALLALVCMAYFSSTSLSLAQTANMRAVTDAQMAVESGFSFMVYQVDQCDPVGSVFVEDLFTMVRTGIVAHLNGTPNLGAGVVHVDATGTLITIPDIDLGENRSFKATLQLLSVLKPTDTMRLIVVGQSRNGDLVLTRRMSVDYKLTGGVDGPLALKYAISSAGKITLENNAEISGKRSDDEASIYSSWVHPTEPSIVLKQNVKVPGGVFTAPGAVVNIDPGNIPTAELNEPVPMPRFDPDLYLLKANTGLEPGSIADGGDWTIIDVTTNLNVSEFSNVIIKANTNPDFSKNGMSLKGIIYIESPNNVKFSGNNMTLQAYVVGQAAPSMTEEEKLEKNTVYFANNLIVKRPDELEGDQYAKIRDLPNVCMVLPDFTMEFKNNLDTATFTGLVAVNKLITKNNFKLHVDGGIMVYGPGGFQAQNGMKMFVSLTSVVPLGFDGYVPKASYGLRPDYNTFWME